ncbi:hypothetical protein J3E69DRAFT_380921 [Trichoderma sp. SZMC 28015]
MPRELLIPADHEFPLTPESVAVDSELLEKFLSQILPQCTTSSSVVGETNTEAQKKKEEFINLLIAWDEEHDHIIDATKSHKLGGRFFKDKPNLIAEVRSNILEAHSWKEVFHALQNAKETYSNPRGVKVVRKWFRKAADKSNLVEPFVDFIPNADFSSVICGGMKFILKACMASKAFREQAFELIGQLPEKVGITGQYLQLYQSDAQLQDACSELFCNILSAIQSIMYWLMKDHAFEWLKPILQQSSYNPLEERIKDVGKSSARVDQIIRLCISKQVSQISGQVDKAEQNITWIKKAAETLLVGMMQQAKWYSAIQQHIMSQASQSLEQKPEVIIPQKDLLLLLDPNAVAKHTAQKQILKQVLHTGFSMGEEAQKRVEWLLTNKNIAHWFTSTGSQIILVNGHGPLERITPMSFFCAMLAQSLNSTGSIILLSHFCGVQMLDRNSQDPKEQKSSGLLRSLLIQLLAQWKSPNITCLEHDFIEKLKRTSPNWSSRRQRHLFQYLVAALPRATPIFIIIDGITYYEVADLRDDVKKVVKEVNKLLCSESVEAMVKILITSPTRSFNLTEYFEINEIINVPEDIDDTITNFSESNLKLQFDSKAAALERKSTDSLDMENALGEQTNDVIESTLAKSLDQLIADQRLMLALLQRKFEPISDIPKIAEKIWNSTDDAWTGSDEASKMPEDRSLGTEFLSTLEPCGTSITGSDGNMDQDSNVKTKTWISEDNLVIARRTLEGWIRDSAYLYSPLYWNIIFWPKHSILNDGENITERIISQVSERWPNAWDPSRFSPIREPQYNSYGNRVNIYYTSPRVKNISAPLEYTPSYITSKIQVRRQVAHCETSPDFSPQRLREQSSIKGIICQVSLQYSPGIIDFETMATILCLSRIKDSFPKRQYDFVDTHLHGRSMPKATGLSQFQSSRHIIAREYDDPGLLYYGAFMHHMTSFTVFNSEQGPFRKENPSSGFKCERMKIHLKAFYDDNTQSLVQRRYSTMLSVFPTHYPSGHFVLLSLIDIGEYELKTRDKTAADTGDHSREERWKNYGIYPAGLYAGISVLQLEICSFIELWENDWNLTINRIEEMVSVQPHVLNDDQWLRELVLDTNPDDLVLYFKVLQILRMFHDIIIADTARLKSFSVNVQDQCKSVNSWQQSYKHNEDTQKVLEYNWNIVRKRQQEAADKISTRIKQTKEELYNVQSVTEAQKSRKLNKYLMVFTIVTVIFLPPSFAATFFGMDAFQSSDNNSTQRTFWTVLGILSGLTYAIAGMGLFGANISITGLRKRLYLVYAETMDKILCSESLKKLRSGIRQISPWFAKVKNIWVKSPKEPRDLSSDTQRGNRDGGGDVPPV